MIYTQEDRTRLERKRLLRRKRVLSRRIGLLLTSFQFLLSVAVMGFLFYLNLLPATYMAAVAAALLFLTVYCFFSQLTRRHRTFGKMISILVSVFLIFGCYYLAVTTNVFSDITGNRYKTENISVYVLRENSAQNISDCVSYLWGYQTLMSDDITQQAFRTIEEELGRFCEKAAYSSFNNLVASLYDGESDVILINDSQLETILDYYPSFRTDTRILKTYTFRTQVNIDSPSVDVTKESFVVYISGIDVYGDISQTSRSDVNIIAVVNPNTKKVLLVSTPRDSYVELPVEAGAYDKLTHAGNYGVETSMKTLSNLYDIEIGYYLRVNFTGFIDIVDAIGGITIENEESFTSHDGYYFEEGTLSLDGLYALHYARERKAFALGDVQRGINQMKVIRAMIKKACSPTLLTNFSDIMESVSGCMETNMTMSEISSLVRLQLKDNASWDISSVYLEGENHYMPTYSYPDWDLDVYVIDEESLAEVKAQIQTVMNGN